MSRLVLYKPDSELLCMFGPAESTVRDLKSKEVKRLNNEGNIVNSESENPYLDLSRKKLRVSPETGEELYGTQIYYRKKFFK